MIKYRKYKNCIQGNASYGKWFARVAVSEMIDLDALAEHMSSHQTPYSYGTIHGVLKDMVRCIRELVLDSKAVKLDDLCILKAALECTPADTAGDFKTSKNIKSVKLSARATGIFRKADLSAISSVGEYSEYSIDDSTDSTDPSDTTNGSTDSGNSGSTDSGNSGSGSDDDGYNEVI